jgi:methyl-accepting chemotaxis protein
MKELTIGSQNISKQIGLITKANLEHSTGVEGIVNSLDRTREAAEENSADAENLRLITDGLLGNSRSARGNRPRRPDVAESSNGHEPPRNLARGNGRP